MTSIEVSVERVSLERRGFMIGAGLAVVAALGLGIWLTSAGDGRGSVRAGQGDAEEESQFGSRSFGSRPMEEPRAEARPGVVPPGRPLQPQVGERPGLLQPMRPPLGAQAPSETEQEIAPPRADPFADRSSGWRLGRARARIQTVETRLTALRARREALVAENNPVLAQQQAVIIQRFENRMTLLRDEVTQLESEARSDGTIGEADQGFTESQELQRPQVRSPAQ